MKKIREILRMLWAKELGARPTARACKASHSTVLEYERRAVEAGLSWEQVEEMDSGTLERQLFPHKASAPVRPLPAWAEVHRELKRPGVTLQLLWEEYREVHLKGYEYSRFCDLYRTWRGKLDLSPQRSPEMHHFCSLRMTHLANFVTKGRCSLPPKGGLWFIRPAGPSLA
jgi:hypothetical protein